MQKLLFVLMFLVVTYQVEGGIRSWITKKRARYCYCKAVDADSHRVLHNFGAIQSCRGWPKCRCGQTEMITCGDQCDRRVTNWLKNHRSKCRFARTWYKADTCGTPKFGHHRKRC